MSYPIEPFRIKTIQKIQRKTPSERERILTDAKYNVFKIESEDVYIDLLTDSGTGAMSTDQWSAIMMGDESYAGATSFFRLKQVVEEIFKFQHFIPTHQGRAAEHILNEVLVKPGHYIPSNTHFDTTEANIRACGGNPVNIPETRKSTNNPFGGNIDLKNLSSFIKDVGAYKIPYGMLTITNNGAGGLPVSLDNIRGASEIYRSNGIPFFIDACRYAENSYLIKKHEEPYINHTVEEISKEVFSCCDGITMSGKKDGLVNIGGFLAVNDSELFSKIKNIAILREGFPTYGGLSGRDLDAMAVGLKEGIEEDYLEYRTSQTAYLGEGLREIGVPVLQPFGGHAVYVDSAAMFPHIPVEDLPGITLSSALYLAGGIRSVELGSVAFAHFDETLQKIVRPPLELVRLALPRRTYTQAHLDFVIRTFDEVLEKVKTYKGYEITWSPEHLRHFTAEFNPKS